MNTLASYARLVRDNANFRRLWLAQIVSEIGDWLYTIVIYALLLDLTGSASAVAAAAVLQVLPQVFISPMAGVVNDRLSRRSVMIATDVVRACIILCMAAAVYWQLLWPIYVLLFLETVMWSFFEPGRTAILPNLVKKEDLLAANSLSSLTWSANLAVGAALGGLLAVVIGSIGVLALDAASFLVSAFFLLRIRVEETHASEYPPLRTRDLFDFAPILKGFRYMAADRRLLALLFVKGGIGLVGIHYVILPVFGERVFPVYAGGLDSRRAAMLGMSLLMASRGMGALIGPLAAGDWARQSESRMRSGITYGFVAVAAGFVGLSLAPTLALACAAILIGHAGTAIVWVFQTTMLQRIAVDEFRGRVFSADFAFMTSAMAACTYVGGAVIDAGVPVRTLTLAMGILCLLPPALWILVALPLWRDTRGSTDPRDSREAL